MQGFDLILSFIYNSYLGCFRFASSWSCKDVRLFCIVGLRALVNIHFVQCYIYAACASKTEKVYAIKSANVIICSNKGKDIKWYSLHHNTEWLCFSTFDQNSHIHCAISTGNTFLLHCINSEDLLNRLLNQAFNGFIG